MGLHFEGGSTDSAVVVIDLQEQDRAVIELHNFASAAEKGSTLTVGTIILDKHRQIFAVNGRNLAKMFELKE